MASSTFRSAVRRGLTFWRRSIQARVVASTIVLSAIVVGAVGWFLLQQTRDGLLEHRVDAVLTEVGTAMADANAQLDGASTTDNDINEQRNALAFQLQQRANSRGFTFVLNGPVGSTTEFGEGADYTEGLDTASVPVSMRQHFDEVAATAWAYTRIRQSGQAPEPGIVVGSQVQLPADGGLYTV